VPGPWPRRGEGCRNGAALSATTRPGWKQGGAPFVASSGPAARQLTPANAQRDERAETFDRDARILDNFPAPRAADLVNAWAYASAHADEIQQAIQENEAA
jgi:hypothetical protein